MVSAFSLVRLMNVSPFTARILSPFCRRPSCVCVCRGGEPAQSRDLRMRRAISRMHNAISRLRKFSDCAEQIHTYHEFQFDLNVSNSESLWELSSANCIWMSHILQGNCANCTMWIMLRFENHLNEFSLKRRFLCKLSEHQYFWFLNLSLLAISTLPLFL